MRDDVVTLGSEVTSRDLTVTRLHTVSVVYPEDADIDQHRISVLTRSVWPCLAQSGSEDFLDHAG
jgi:transcription elongation GreA/GreB family factor